jgi:hypothetical protein
MVIVDVNVCPAETLLVVGAILIAKSGATVTEVIADALAEEFISPL